MPKLPSGRNDLEHYLYEDRAMEYLTDGRLLESDFHDAEGIRATGSHMHWYRKILRGYDSEKGTVLLSQKGSRRLLKELDTPDKEFTLEELAREFEQNWWNLREANYELF